MKEMNKIGCMWAAVMGGVILFMSFILAIDLGRTFQEFWEILLISNAVLWAFTFIIAIIILKILDKTGF